MEDAKKTVLLQARSSGDAINRLYLLRKSCDSKVSLGYVCRKLGIPSRGYLSDVLRGRKIVAEKYLEGITRFFSLVDEEAAVLLELHRKDRRKSDSKDSLLDIARRRLQMTGEGLPSPGSLAWSGAKLFCLIDVLKGNANEANLEKLWGSKERLGDALNYLREGGFVRVSDGVWEIQRDYFLFKEGEGTDLVNFLKAGIRHAGEMVESNFSDADKSLFTGSILSVKRSQYVPMLSELRMLLNRFQVNSVSKEADMVVHFNVQIFPDEQAAASTGSH